MTREEVLASIRQTAEALGCDTLALSRSDWCAHTGRGNGSLGRMGGWRQLRREAAGKPAPVDVIPEGHLLKGASTLVGPDGEIKAQWVKTYREQEAAEETMRRLLAEIPAEVIALPRGAIPKPDKRGDDDLLAIYPFGDPHIGMLSWGEETGEDFDLPKARSILHAAIDELTDHSPRCRHGLVIWLGDNYHADDQSNRTPKSGHQLDMDSRHFKVLRAGVECAAYMIERALQVHDSVEFWPVRGNHDPHAGMVLAIALHERYRNEPRVTVNLSPSLFFWHRFGKCLIGATHGDKVKLGQLGQIMACDRAKDWGETEHRFFYRGHVHTSERQELPGVVVESFRTLAPRDAYAAGHGYRSGRDAHRIVLHRERGEAVRSTVSAEYLKTIYEAA